MRKEFILFLIFCTLSGFSQGSITLSPEKTTIEAKTDQPLIFSTGNRERLKIGSDGNIGIGQPGPSYKLDILHGGATGIRIKSTATFSVLDIDAFNGDAAIRFGNNGENKWNVRNQPTSDNFEIFELGGGGSRFQIQNGTGNIGIGTALPKSKMHVSNGSSGINGTPADELIVESNNNNYIQMMNPQANEAGLLFGLPSNIVSGGIIFNNSQSGALDFRTNNDQTQMRIDNVGKVGIGTTSPLGKLQINHNPNGDDASPHIAFRQTVDASFGRIRYENSTGERYFLQKFDLSSATAASNKFMWSFGTDELLRLTGDGKLGIGTTPSAKLDINGDIVIKKKTVLPNTTQTINNLDRVGASIISTGAASSAQTITITGISGGVDGMMLWIYPTTNFTIRLEDENVGSLAANRIKTTVLGSANVLSVRGGATLIYDGTEDRWHVVDAN